MELVSELRDFSRHAAGLRDYLKQPMTVEGSVAVLRDGLARREERFLDTIGRGVFGQADSPYLRLFRHAGIERGDLNRLVRDEGVDGAVSRLYDAGVSISKAEFRGEAPIERPGLSFPVQASDFDNPLANATWRVSTGGSRSMGRQVLINFAHYERQAMYYALFLWAHGAEHRPEGMWGPYAARTSVNNALRSQKLGLPLERWFTQTRVTERPFRARETVLTTYALVASHLWASGLPRPVYVPTVDAARIARWLADKARQGTPALLNSSVGPAVRVCLAAREHGIDIAGSLFRTGGEPLTPARADVFVGTGSTVFADYAMAESGRVGVSCAAPNAVGDVHLLLDKVAAIQRPREVPGTGETVDALLFSTLLPMAPKLMLNVETDDYAIAEDRACGCRIGELGYTRHLHGIRSYEKLTSEGTSMRGPDVLLLLEQTLPQRFGGSPTDYQLVDEPEQAVPTLSVLVSPRVGPVDEGELVEVVLSTLAQSGPGPEEMAKLWRVSGTLRVVRREPHQTSAGKVLPIHVVRRAAG